MQRRILLTTVPALALASAARAQGRDPAFAAWIQGVRAEAAAKGVDARTLDAAFRDVAPIPRVLELDRSQPEFKMTYADYLARVVSEERVRRGRELLRENRALVERFAGVNGVPPSLIVALWGIESNYGTRLGDFSVIASLATLAYNGRRAQFFRSELIAALRILAQGHIAPEAMKGSWAGAMGQCQFMPSSFLAYAVDGDGDGKRDIWGNRPDVFASIGNYMRRVGWNPAFGWGREVTGQANPAAPQGGALSRPAGAGGPVYAVTPNFAAIKRWNNSEFFALAVGILSDRIAA